MTSNLKGFLYYLVDKYYSTIAKAQWWYNNDSVVLSQEQMMTINGICGKTKNVQYLSIIQERKSKVIHLRIQFFLPDGNVIVTDNIPISVTGKTLVDSGGSVLQ